MPVARAGFEQQHLRPILAQPVGKHAARRSGCADDHANPRADRSFQRCRRSSAALTEHRGVLGLFASAVSFSLSGFDLGPSAPDGQPQTDGLKPTGPITPGSRGFPLCPEQGPRSEEGTGTPSNTSQPVDRHRSRRQKRSCLVDEKRREADIRASRGYDAEKRRRVVLGICRVAADRDGAEQYASRRVDVDVTRERHTREYSAARFVSTNPATGAAKDNDEAVSFRCASSVRQVIADGEVAEVGVPLVVSRQHAPWEEATPTP